MYQNGWGFPKNLAKAAGAISKSETAMISSLGGDDLPDWKREAHNSYAGRIRALSQELKRPDIEPDASVCD